MTKKELILAYEIKCYFSQTRKLCQYIYKGTLIKNAKGYRRYVKSVLNEQGIDDTSDTVEAFSRRYDL